ncbi:MAG: hypothetical protein ABH821_02575 [archaeon]
MFSNKIKLFWILSLVLVVIVLGGCVNQDGTVPGSYSSCSIDADCPDSFSCTNGVCTTEMSVRGNVYWDDAAEEVFGVGEE